MFPKPCEIVLRQRLDTCQKQDWHTGFMSTIEATHPINIFKFIEALHREQVLADTQYELQEIITEEPPVKR